MEWYEIVVGAVSIAHSQCGSHPVNGHTTGKSQMVVIVLSYELHHHCTTSKPSIWCLSVSSVFTHRRTRRRLTDVALPMSSNEEVSVILVTPAPRILSVSDIEAERLRGRPGSITNRKSRQELVAKNGQNWQGEAGARKRAMSFRSWRNIPRLTSAIPGSSTGSSSNRIQ